MSNNQTPIIIKKYPNRRLYNTSISDYITLDDLYEMVKQHIDFIVQDVKSGEDLTRITLTQIIFERESSGLHILPISFLRQLILYYDDNLGSILPYYLESTMNIFSKNQEKIRELTTDYMNSALNRSFLPFKFFEEITKQNMSIFEKTFNFFSSNSSTSNEQKTNK